MRGSSGAVLEIKPRSVRKWGPATTIGPRVLDQGRFLLEIQGKGIVRVGELIESGPQLGYTMEHLTVPPIDLLDTRTIIECNIRVLADHVWCKLNDPVQYDPVAHRNRMAPLWAYAGQAQNALPKALEEIEHWFVSDKLNACKTHGDPIIDNVLLRGDQVVLTDPIRATPAIPDLKCVDIGRLMQSMAGYERIRYGLSGPRSLDLEAMRRMIPGGISYEEWVCSVYWTCCHLLRSMHYVDDDIKAALLKGAYLPTLDYLNQVTKG